MNKCTNCNYTTENSVNFCPMCGGRMVAQETAYQPAPPQHIVPLAYESRTVSTNKPNKAKMIVGMALAIDSFATAIIMFFYVIALADLFPELGLTYAFVFALINLPIGIVGLVLSKDTTDGYNTPIFCRLGKIFGLIAVILTGVTLFLALLMCA